MPRQSAIRSIPSAPPIANQDPPLNGRNSGQSVVLEITGAFRQDVGDDPQFMLNATYGSVRSIDTVEKLCDHVDIVQDQALSCPPRKGKAVITSTFFIHELMIPPVRGSIFLIVSLLFSFFPRSRVLSMHG